MHIICAVSGRAKMKTFFTVLFITAAVVFLVCIIFRGETPDKPKKNIKSDNPAILPYGKTGVLAHRSGAGRAPGKTLPPLPKNI